MLPQSKIEEPRNSSKVNLLISFGFHAALVLALTFFAAHEGLLGKQLRKITVQMVQEKAPEKPKAPEKQNEVQQPKAEPPKAPRTEVASAVKSAPVAAQAPPPAVAAPPVVAPPVAEMPSLVFDGGKTVQTSSDPVQLYKGALEYALRAKWNRPAAAEDDNYVDEVEISVDRSGDISQPILKKTSGDSRWDASVLGAIAAVRNIGRAPPLDFPSRVVVRFDVEETEAISQ
jgi:outer membrane biosynthesis protein TonB